MHSLLVLALALASQGTRVTAPQAPAAPRAVVERVLTYPANQVGTLSGSFHRLRLLTPDGWESFGLYVPDVPSAAQAPLLVHFHAFNGNHLELAYYAGTMLQEADARGWFLVAPDQDVRNAQGQVDGKTYGCDEAQRRVEAVLDWTLATFPIDRQRLYAYGFSMGGGDVLSYAAQHLDPERGAFAAVINHTGTLVLSEEWTRNNVARPPLEGYLAGTPSSEWYAYRRASCIEYPWSPTAPSAFTGAGSHPATNLAFTPVRSYFHLGDLGHQRAYEFMGALDTLVLDHDVELPASILLPSGQVLQHAWEYLDPDRACDWFVQHTLVVPSAGSLVAARDARYHDLRVSRRTPGTFAKVTFDLTPQSSTVLLDGISNVRTLELDFAASRLAAPGNLFTLEVGRDTHPGHAGQPVTVRVRNLPFVPTAVEQRNAPPGQGPQAFQFVNGVLSITSSVQGVTLDVFDVS